MTEVKQQLYNLCIDYVQNRINEAKQAIEDAQDAASEETKSSAGDKFETAREMMQQETDRNQAQLNEANKLMTALGNISYNKAFSKIEPGSLVTTSNGKFFVAISAGTLHLDAQTYYAVSPVSPIGLKLSGKKAGDEFDLNGRAYKIEEVS
jgi:transcription elongation GreA/GreB family factor